MIERWVTKAVAVTIVREIRGASDFKARTLLDQAVAEGVGLNVRGVLRTRASIPDEAWLRGGMGAEGKRHMDGPVGDPINVSEHDLREWLDQLQKSETLIPEPQPTPAPASKPGPKPGILRRYEKSDRKLFPKLEKLVRDEKLSLTAATQKLAELGLIDGIKNSDNKSRAARLSGLTRQRKASSLDLARTKSH